MDLRINLINFFLGSVAFKTLFAGLLIASSFFCKDQSELRKYVLYVGHQIPCPETFWGGFKISRTAVNGTMVALEARGCIGLKESKTSESKCMLKSKDQVLMLYGRVLSLCQFIQYNRDVVILFRDRFNPFAFFIWGST